MTHQQQRMEKFDCCGRVGSSFSYGTQVLYCVVRPWRLKLMEGMKSRGGRRSGSSLCSLLVGHVLGENPRFLLNPGVSRFALRIFQVTFWAQFFDTKFGQFNFACIRPIKVSFNSFLQLNYLIRWDNWSYSIRFRSLWPQKHSSDLQCKPRNRMGVYSLVTELVENGLIWKRSPK